jgi:hypothetical protein
MYLYSRTAKLHKVKMSSTEYEQSHLLEVELSQSEVLSLSLQSLMSPYHLYQTNITTGGENLVYDGFHIPTVTSTQILQVVGGHLYKYRVVAYNRVG